MAQAFIESFKSARQASTPLMAVRTPDPAATMGEVLGIYVDGKDATPILCQDVVRGVAGMNDAGCEAVAMLFTSGEVAQAKEAVEQGGISADSEEGKAEVQRKLAVSLSNPIDMLDRAARLPRRSILFMLNADRFLDQPGFVQAVWNLRDGYKANRRTLMMLCPDVQLPQAIAQDVLVLDEPYPDRDQLAAIVTRAFEDVRKKYPSCPEPKPALLAKAADALTGLDAFAAEQVSFMSLGKDGLNLDGLWERKRQEIAKTVGASVWRGAEKFADICGLSNIVGYLRRLIKSKRGVAVVVFLDEIEKMFAGLQGDLSGVSQKMFGTLLTWMQDHNVIGILLLGPPGTGKSLLAKTVGNEAGVPTIVGDVSGMEAGIIGQSGSNLRAFLKMVEAVAGGKTILMVATCNKWKGLPPELRRRFKRGTFYIDLMSKEEREGAWVYFEKKFKLKKQTRPDDEGWTGAEIEQCCDMAADMDMTLVEAAEFVVPVAQSSKEDIEELRRSAAGRFISASYAGKYRMPQVKGAKQVVGGGREVN